MTDEIDDGSGPSTTRRALIAAVLGAGVGGAALSPARSFLDRFAPLSGSVWRSARRSLPDRVESPHGAATLRYDDYGIPQVSAADEAALYYAVGYAQANDRLFQMDVFRRRMRGRLSELAGPSQLDSDRFHRRMDFLRAAEVTWAATSDTGVGSLVRAYADGVNDFIENERLPFEFRAAEYEPEPWTPVDTILQQKQIAWGLTGDFRTLRLAAVRDVLGADAVADLFPARYDFDQPIIQPDHLGDAELRGIAGETGRIAGEDDTDAGRIPGGSGETADAGDRKRRPVTRPGHDEGVGPDLAAHLSGFEWPDGIGSNSWVIGPEHTATGRPILCNDTHLLLTAPPVWYEMTLDAPDYSVRGFTFPGVPFVVIGENEHGAWGFTNSNADVIDFYEYEIVEGGDAYRYDGESREFETRTETIPVSGGEDEELLVRETVHGPLLERAGQRVGVSWLGLAATRTTRAVYGLNRSEGLDDALAAIERFDEPSQNFVYADRDGRTAYYTTGKLPIRRVDGEVVPGNRIFDGSAAEGEWTDFEPYGDADWEGEGFVPFEEMPGVIDPPYLATANQRIADDPTHYVAENYSDPYRGIRAYDRLDRRIGEEDEPVTPEFVKDLQRDTLDGRATRLVPAILEAGDRMSERARRAADALEGWDYRMTREDRAPLVFERFFQHFRQEAFAGPFQRVADAVEAEDNSVSAETFFPSPWITATLPADSRWFDGDRGAVIAAAMDETAAELAEADWETYGDYQTADFAHPLGSALPFLNYPAVPTPGSAETLRNFHATRDAGTSQRLVAYLADDRDSEGVLPGGNSGDYFSDHYADQLRMWADGEYRGFTREQAGDVAIEFDPAEGE